MNISARIITGRPRLVLMVMISLYTITLFSLCRMKFANLAYTDFDLAVHAQSVRNILHGSIDSSILGIPFPGNHMSLILFFIAPAYALFPTPLTLLFLQTAALAIGAIGIYLLAREALSDTWALVLSAAYLIYPPLIYLNLYEFHPVSLAVCFLIFMMLFYKTHNYAAFTGSAILAILCQENIALIVAASSLCGLIERRSGRWIWAPALLGSIYFLSAVFLIMPRLNNNTVQFWQLYAHLGDSPAAIAINIFTHPLAAISTMIQPDKLAFITSLLAPLGFLSLADPLSLIPALPVLFQRLLSDRLSETRIIFHYQAEFIPFIFAAAIFAIKRILSWPQKVIHLAIIIILAVFPIAALVASGLPAEIDRLLKSLKGQQTMIHRMNAALKEIPGGASVLSTFRFLPKLSNHARLYSLHHVYTGKYTLSSVNYPNPTDIQYAILDTMDTLTFSADGFHDPRRYLNLQAMISSGTWKVLHNLETLLILEKTAATNGPAPELVSIVQPGSVMNTNILQHHPASLELAGFTLEPSERNDPARLTIFWKKNKPDPEEYDIHLTILEDGLLYQGVLAPGSRIWPTQSWPDLTQTNAIIADRHNIFLGRQIADPSKIQLQAAIVPIN